MLNVIVFADLNDLILCFLNKAENNQHKASWTRTPIKSKVYQYHLDNWRTFAFTN